ncbi:MAG: hypothetical protein EG822_07105 [Deltaproteobacteria bacterium]|nr:hypothetical protein [Deltaproteobacteria bacterium]TLN01978.1 MAG: hypothetical protein FDZ73_13730 [bacterium]
MLPFFPTPYRDELLYSVFARYHLRSANNSFRATLVNLFGSPTVCATFGLPTCLDALAERITSNRVISMGQLIRDHTLFPFYRPFLSQERADKVIRQMCDPNLGSGIHNTIGQMASRLPAACKLRYCTICIEEDGDDFGEPYWHRSHQVFGVRVCHRHGKRLVDSEVKTGIHGMKHAFIALEPVHPKGDLPDTENQSTVHDKWFADQVFWLMNQSHALPVIGLENLWLRYKYYLSQMGLTTVHGNIICRELMKRFSKFYQEDFLKELHSYFVSASTQNWLLDLVRKPRGVSHPLHHLLLIRFLGLSVKNFISEEVESVHPFGRCPWPCLNRAAAHFRKELIWHCTITRNSETGAPVGTFACSCGFNYARTGPDHTQENRYQYSRIVAFGRVWEKRLQDLAGGGKSLREIARQLSVDPKTVHRHLALAQETTSEVFDATEYYAEREMRRKKWLELYESQSSIGVKAARNQAPAHYAWLYRHDKQWLIEHCPRQHRSQVVNFRLDWNLRDEELSARIDEAVERIKKRVKPAVRVSISSIGKELGALALLQRCIDKLPITKSRVNNLLETKEDFVARRLKRGEIC